MEVIRRQRTGRPGRSAHQEVPHDVSAAAGPGGDDVAGSADDDQPAVSRPVDLAPDRLDRRREVAVAGQEQHRDTW